MNYFYLFTIFLIILNINNINSSIITFNNNIISECTSDTPCDLSSNNIWENNQAPHNGDDVVIDFSNESNQNIYLFGENFHIQLNSFTLKGQITNTNNLKTIFYTSLTIQNSNFTIINDFTIQNSNVAFNETSDNNIINIGNFVSNITSFTMDGYSSVKCNSTNLYGVQQFNILGQSSFNVNGTATIDTQINHRSTGLLSLSGPTTISDIFNSIGTVSFGPYTTTISSQTEIDTAFLSGRLVIVDGNNVMINEYITLNELSQIFVTQSSSLIIKSTIDSSHIPRVSYQVILEDSSSLFVPSGFTFLNSTSEMNGTINIQDNNNETIFYEVEQPLLNISTSGNITLLGTLVNMVFCESNTLVNVVTSSGIYSLLGNGDVYVSNTLSLYKQSIARTINISKTGLLAVFGILNAQQINVAYAGALANYGSLNSDIYSSGQVLFKSMYSNAKSINIQDSGSLVIDYPSLQIEGNLNMGPFSTLNIKNVNLNDVTALINLEGNLNVNPSRLTIQLNQTQATVKQSDSILLFVANGVYNNTVSIAPNVISVLTSSGSLVNLNPLLQRDSTGIYKLEFKNKNFPSPGLIAGAVAGSVAGVVLIVIIVVCCYKRKKNPHHHHHHEQKPLIR
ncbi:hypothetical protein DICPUDRAFT_150192 [Dictyostelium purpureum]|uniref:Uncharacterized protein n=1 Tax=Dictyostelium purpureum TaxID=5786 RepID=F0ZFP1_DICPU|nr:uncharacterized protein DICPUDRAFT_150192 [Dictyostelium purpureum]EGC37268.1 hypothetical protein DICPUDRAFT_150192 [Dictyostelium purpureum]|eukprot:XP_003286238.1 hypothetical protein DICPUDRAFT_150192 [Dictyostelium purpureum]